jgi:hypothetical protein
MASSVCRGAAPSFSKLAGGCGFIWDLLETGGIDGSWLGDRAWFTLTKAMAQFQHEKLLAISF